MKYAVIIEASERNYSAYVPDLPGCIATGKTLDEVKRLMTSGAVSRGSGSTMARWLWTQGGSMGFSQGPLLGMRQEWSEVPCSPNA
jgi:hypothetical protein